jgi:hypothetical protein
VSQRAHLPRGGARSSQSLTTSDSRIEAPTKPRRRIAGGSVTRWRGARLEARPRRPIDATVPPTSNGPSEWGSAVVRITFEPRRSPSRWVIVRASGTAHPPRRRPREWSDPLQRQPGRRDDEHHRQRRRHPRVRRATAPALCSLRSVAVGAGWMRRIAERLGELIDRDPFADFRVQPLGRVGDSRCLNPKQKPPLCGGFKSG